MVTRRRPYGTDTRTGGQRQFVLRTTWRFFTRHEANQPPTTRDAKFRNVAQEM